MNLIVTLVPAGLLALASPWAALSLQDSAQPAVVNSTTAPAAGTTARFTGPVTITTAPDGSVQEITAAEARFTQTSDASPQEAASSQMRGQQDFTQLQDVAATDFDGDGDVDLFISNGAAVGAAQYSQARQGMAGGGGGGGVFRGRASPGGGQGAAPLLGGGGSGSGGVGGMFGSSQSRRAQGQFGIGGGAGGPAAQSDDELILLIRQAHRLRHLGDVEGARRAFLSAAQIATSYAQALPGGEARNSTQMSSGRAPRASSRQMRGTQIRSAGNAPAASAVSSARRTLFPATDASPAAQAAPAATAAAQTELAFANSIVRSAVDRLVVEAPVAANVVEWSAGDTADAPAAEVANLPADSSLDQHALLRLVRAVQDEVQALRRELAELRQQLLDRPEPQITDATSPAETPWGRTWSGGR